MDRLTLADWETKYREKAGEHPTGARFVPFVSPSEKAWELFHLSDFVVSSVQAGTVCLVPRKTPILPC